MQPGQILRNILPQTAPVSAVSFRPGQIIQGTITKLFPNQTAEVRIGQTKLIAVIDAPLEAFEKYWFRVEAGEDLTRLKVLDSKLTGYAANDAAQLLQHLSLPIGKEQLKLASFLLKNGIPATREILENILGWLQASDKLDLGFAAMKTMHSKNIPFIEENFQAIYSLEMGKSFSSQLGRLVEQLQTLPEHSPASLKLLETAGSLMETNAAKWADKALLDLARLWLADSGGSQKAFQVLKNLGFIPAEAAEDQMLNSLLNRTNLEKLRDTRLKHVLNVLGKITAASSSQDAEAAKKLLAGWNGTLTGSTAFNEEPGRLKSGNSAPDSVKGESAFLPSKEVAALTKHMLGEVITKTNEKNVSETTKLTADIKTFLSSLSGKQQIDYSLNKLGSEIASRLDVGPMQLRAGQYSEDMNWFFSSIVKDFGPDFSKADDIKLHLKQMIKDLGLEQFLSAPIQEAEPDTQSALKFALTQFLNSSDEKLLKQTAEQLLHRMHAQQLLSNENGPLQNMVMQIPLPFNEQISDLTVQWNGRKSPDGSIDSSYCRILFYLELGSLNEVAVDMQVQNRIVRLTVYNQHIEAVKDIAQKWIPGLKENFNKIHYTLSSIHFMSSHEGAFKPQVNAFKHQSSSYSGVDFRI
ncbi:hypothetical protein JOC77_001716 [Peribacillus deserti]|uniref:Flagellar hook-length control protein-like C-terminal domain-containing protein n=1 Tax=Peribacillus deserti TaxID=673318 RepID=A0ABS2QGJ6_9BACI|nr:hypothetical protein [Peribacillus deserti]MBM7692286.1 hypothetical protein [Peribacillus deserti]